MLKAWWVSRSCPDGHLHRWQVSVQTRTKTGGCPYCFGQRVCPHNSLARKAPHLAKEWDSARNAGSPYIYTVSAIIILAGPANVGNAGKQGSEVAEHQDRLSSLLGPASRLPVLTATSSHIMQLWDLQRNKEQDLDPNTLTCGPIKQGSFVCKKCPESQMHRWTARICQVNRGSCCPYCSGHKVCKCRSLQSLRPDVAADWCYANNHGTPADYTAQRNLDVWWVNDHRGI